MTSRQKDGSYHTKKECKGKYCCFHNPSKHHMVGWKLNVRLDRSGLTERICPHGIGHPDPDSLDWLQRRGVNDEGIHGCDGCCASRFEVIRKDD